MQAFVLRIAPSGIDRLHEALETDEVMIGWCRCAALIDPALRRSGFRSALKQQYYPTVRRSTEPARRPVISGGSFVK